MFVSGERQISVAWRCCD